MIDRIQLLKELEKDDEFKQQFLDALLKDEKFIFAMAREVFSVPVTALGIKSAGTLGEYVYKKGLENEKSAVRNKQNKK